MIEIIRKFSLRKAGLFSIAVGILAIITHILLIVRVLPYTWINGGRSESFSQAVGTSASSIVTILIGMLITLIASRIIPIKLNKFFTIILMIYLWISIPFDIIGIAEQLMGTIFEKCCMSILTIAGFLMDFRLAVEKRL